MSRKTRFGSISGKKIVLFLLLAIVLIYFLTKKSNSGSSGSTNIAPGGLGTDISPKKGTFANINKSRFGAKSSLSPSESGYITLTTYPNGKAINSSLEMFANKIPSNYYPGVLFDNKDYQILYMIMNYNLNNKTSNPKLLYNKIGITGPTPTATDFNSISTNIKNLSKDDYNLLSYFLLSSVYMMNDRLRGFVNYSKTSPEAPVMDGIFIAIAYFLNYDIYNNVDTIANGYNNYMLSGGNFGDVKNFSKGTTNITPGDLDISKPVKNILLAYNGKADANSQIVFTINDETYPTDVAWFDNPNYYTIQIFTPDLDYTKGYKINSLKIELVCPSGTASITNTILSIIYY